MVSDALSETLFRPYVLFDFFIDKRQQTPHQKSRIPLFIRVSDGEVFGDPFTIQNAHIQRVSERFGEVLRCKLNRMFFFATGKKSSCYFVV